MLLMLMVAGGAEEAPLAWEPLPEARGASLRVPWEALY